jgi:hypothetical protein
VQLDGEDPGVDVVVEWGVVVVDPPPPPEPVVTDTL